MPSVFTIGITLSLVSFAAGVTQPTVDNRPCIIPKGNATDFKSLCTPCTAGEGFTSFCRQVQLSPTSWCYLDQLCAECERGRYQDKKSHSEACLICQTCDRDKGLLVIAECSRTSNTICGCAAGFYFDKQLDRCTRCSQCSPGQQPSDCRGEIDTTCSACPNGTFSDGQTNCRQCTKCGANQQAMSECNARNDTVCVAMHNPSTDGDGANSRVNLAADGDDDTFKNNLMIYLSCGLMAIVVLVVVSYALWKHCSPPIGSKRAIVVGSHANSDYDHRSQLYAYATVTVDEKPHTSLHFSLRKLKQRLDSTSAAASTLVNLTSEVGSKSASLTTNVAGAAESKLLEVEVNRANADANANVTSDKTSYGYAYDHDHDHDHDYAYGYGDSESTQLQALIDGKSAKT